MRDQYEAELSELEQSQRKLQERCSELKGRLGAAEGEEARLQALLRQREKELDNLRAVSAPPSQVWSPPPWEACSPPSLWPGQRRDVQRARQPG